LRARMLVISSTDQDFSLGWVNSKERTTLQFVALTSA
jgi:hypothetical protein